MNPNMMVLQEEYDSTVAGHIGQEKTIDLEWTNFFWPQME
jgi:hypothetical protein